MDGPKQNANFRRRNKNVQLQYSYTVVLTRQTHTNHWRCYQ